MKYAARLAHLEQRAVPTDVPILVIRRTRAEDGCPLCARVVTHDGGATPAAIAARDVLQAQGYRVAVGYGSARCASLGNGPGPVATQGP